MALRGKDRFSRDQGTLCSSSRGTRQGIQCGRNGKAGQDDEDTEKLLSCDQRRGPPPDIGTE